MHTLFYCLLRTCEDAPISASLPSCHPVPLLLQDIGQAVCEKLFTSGAAPVASCLVEEKKGGWLTGRPLGGHWCARLLK